jgi:hypothetical protein
MPGCDALVFVSGDLAGSSGSPHAIPGGLDLRIRDGESVFMD